MAMEFNINTIIEVLANSFFGGSTTLAGLAIMMAIFVVLMIFLGAVKAPVQYGLVPMMVLAIFFSYLGIMDSTVSFLIIIVCVVLVANTARELVSKEK